MITLKNFMTCQRGATAIEYVLIAAGIALAILAAVFAFGADLAELYEGLAAAVSGG